MTKKRPTRGYSRAFPTKANAPRHFIMVDRIPPPLMAAIRKRATREGVSLRALLLTFLADWSAQ